MKLNEGIGIAAGAAFGISCGLAIPVVLVCAGAGYTIMNIRNEGAAAAKSAGKTKVILEDTARKVSTSVSEIATIATVLRPAAAAVTAGFGALVFIAIGNHCDDTSGIAKTAAVICGIVCAGFLTATVAATMV